MRANARITMVVLFVTAWVGCGDAAKDAEMAAMKAEMAQLRTKVEQSDTVNAAPSTTERVYVEPPLPTPDSPAPRAQRKNSAAVQTGPETTTVLEEVLAANPPSIPSNAASGTVSTELQRVLEEPAPP